MKDLKLVIKTTAELTSAELLMILKERTRVFVVEQHCPYQEVDDQDDEACHVMLQDHGQLVAYTRIIKHLDGINMSFGRVLVVMAYRGQQLGRQIVAETIKVLRQQFPGAPIKIAAQSRLRDFYGSFGFRPVSDVYLEDDIPHIDMLLEN
ncbi:acetyltransferase [Paucilactobacillus vaccinostercus DSM 20634]|jgi:ElaA protein|uniref:Acetyltransferase n=1 Tax=Paucilactobacillus vaccinostercus DSM 20634 TaxID=1423813 RepID=A0A0R2A2T2_9LACO|nr:GNAT family N-acetyltransferase [Paucilactobacillus vaccinostercus]KRM60789.1 acetyltransferase [Paucilactobacillus vaccinostercus DSM 20634]